jgi:hypothetical protein
MRENFIAIPFNGRKINSPKYDYLVTLEGFAVLGISQQKWKLYSSVIAGFITAFAHKQTLLNLEYLLVNGRNQLLS